MLQEIIAHEIEDFPVLRSEIDVFPFGQLLGDSITPIIGVDEKTFIVCDKFDRLRLHSGRISSKKLPGHYPAVVATARRGGPKAHFRGSPQHTN